MSITTVICNAVKSDGNPCGQPSIVHNSRHEYATELFRDAGGIVGHTLTASHYDIECPDCGNRVQVERHRPLA